MIDIGGTVVLLGSTQHQGLADQACGGGRPVHIEEDQDESEVDLRHKQSRIDG